MHLERCQDSGSINRMHLQRGVLAPIAAHLHRALAAEGPAQPGIWVAAGDLSGTRCVNNLCTAPADPPFIYLVYLLWSRSW
jgi:hypothetical protein